MKKMLFSLFLVMSTTSSFAKNDPEVFCFDKEEPESLYSFDSELGGGKCDDAVNLRSIFNADYGLCYKGSVKEIRSSILNEGIEYIYYGNQYKVLAVLSTADNGGDVIKFQIKDLDSKDKKRLVNIIGVIAPCK